jgi:hypothetical protein
MRMALTTTTTTLMTMETWLHTSAGVDKTTTKKKKKKTTRGCSRRRRRMAPVSSRRTLGFRAAPIPLILLRNATAVGPTSPTNSDRCAVPAWWW